MSFQSEANSTYVNGSSVAKSDVRALWGDVDDVVTTLNRLGVIPLTNIGGTANAITADMTSGTPVASLNANSTVSFTPSASNTGSPVTLFVAGDQARLLRGEDGGDIPAGYLKASRFYIAQRFGAHWKIISGGATYDDLTTISSTIAQALNVVGVTPLINVAGTGDAITADMASNAVNAGMVIAGNALVEFIPAATNANPSPTLLISQDGTARNIQPEDGGAMPAGYLVPGRAYILRRRGSVWRVQSGAVTKAALDAKADLSNTGKAFPSRSSAVSYGQENLPSSLGLISTREGPYIAYRGSGVSADDPLFETAPHWAVTARVLISDFVTAALRDGGGLRLISVGGTANDITAELASSFGNADIGIGQYSTVDLVPTANNTESEVYLTVAGDERRLILRQNGDPLQPADLRFGRITSLTRSGANWRLAGGDLARLDVGTAAFRNSADLLDRNTMTQGSVIGLTATGTGNAIVAEIHGNLPQISLTSAGVLRFVAPGTNTAPNPTITIGGVTRTIFDADGSELPAGAIRWQKMYLLRLSSLTAARIINGPGFSDLPTSASFTEIWDAINGKASMVSVAALEAALAGKAEQVDLEALETVVEGLLSGTHLVGDWDATSGIFPIARPDASEVQAGDQFNVTGTGTVDGVGWAAGDILTALVDDPGATYAGNWTRRAGTATSAAQVATAVPDRTVQDAIDGQPRFSVWDHYQPTDSSVHQAINRAIDAAHAQGGGAVVFERRAAEYVVTGPTVLKSNVDLVNIGMNTLKLADGIDANVVETAGFMLAAATGWNNRDHEVEFFKILGGLKVDGNRAGNPTAGEFSGKGFAIFGREFVIADTKAHNARNEGYATFYVLTGSGASPYGGKIERMEAMNNGKQGWLNGVSDLMFDKINIVNSSLNDHAAYAAVRTERGMRGGSITVWRTGFAPASHSYSIETISGGIMASALSLETGAMGQVWLGDGGLIDCHSYNMIGEGRAHFTLGGGLATIRGRIHQGGLGVVDSIAVLVAAGATISGCRVHLITSGEFGHMLKIDGTSAGANEFDFISRGAATAFPILTGAVHPTDEIRFRQSGGLQRSMHKRPAASSAIVATGAAQGAALAASAALLRHQVNRVTSANEANIAVALPGWLIGLELRVTNLSSREIVIYPQSGDAFVGQAVNAGWAVPPHKSVSVLCEDAGLWSVVG